MDYPSRFGLGVIVILGLGYWITLAANKAEFALTIFVAIIVAFISANQYYVTKKQWRAMERGLKESKNLLEQNNHMIAASNKQADAAESVLKQDRELFMIGERAYVGLDKTILVKPIERGYRPELMINLINAGKTPAWEVELRYTHGLSNGFKGAITEWDDHVHEKLITHTMLPGIQGFRGSRVAFSNDQFETLTSFLFWHIKIEVKYRDIEKIREDTFLLIFDADDIDHSKPFDGLIKGKFLIYGDENEVNQ